MPFCWFCHEAAQFSKRCIKLKGTSDVSTVKVQASMCIRAVLTASIVGSFSKFGSKVNFIQKEPDFCPNLDWFLKCHVAHDSLCQISCRGLVQLYISLRDLISIVILLLEYPFLMGKKLL